MLYSRTRYRTRCHSRPLPRRKIFSRTSLKILLSNTFAPLEEFIQFIDIHFVLFFPYFFLFYFFLFFFSFFYFSFSSSLFPFTRIDHRLMQHSDPCFSQRSTFLRPTATRYLEAVQRGAPLFEVYKEVQRLEEFKEAHEFFLPNGTALSLPLLHAQSQNTNPAQVSCCARARDRRDILNTVATTLYFFFFRVIGFTWFEKSRKKKENEDFSFVIFLSK